MLSAYSGHGSVVTPGPTGGKSASYRVYITRLVAFEALISVLPGATAITPATAARISSRVICDE